MIEIRPEGRTRRWSGGEIGVMVSHGFTGTTESVADWAQALADAGMRVVAPRLTGHATSWRDLDASRWQYWVDDVTRAFDELERQCRFVFVAGLSMGGALALRVAQTRPVAGVLLVNPAIASHSPAINSAGALRWVIPAAPGIASDIRLPGVVEPGYSHVSVRAVHQMTRLWAVVRRDLAAVSAPVVVFKSEVDHVVDDLSVELIRRWLPGAVVRNLRHSYHVATLDHDAALIFSESVEIIERRAARLRHGYPGVSEPA
ncbi:MAG: alpha/beta hydrolase [Arachnia sp.]